MNEHLRNLRPMRPLRKRIDHAALRHNLRLLTKQAGESELFAVVKANAYGHGLRAVLPVLEAADGLAFACLEEALIARKLGYNGQVLILEGIFDPSELYLCAKERLTVMVHNEHQLRWLENWREGSIRAWLKMDSGMHRLGFTATDLGEIIARVRHSARIEWQGLATHFACADDPENDRDTRKQWLDFNAISLPSGWRRSAANSAALLRFPALRADLVRPGLALYGMSPVVGTIGTDFGLRPVMQLSSEVIASHPLKAGMRAGYGLNFVAPEEGELLVIALGYGDGFPRLHPEQRAMVCIRERKMPIVGVAMDMALVWSGPGHIAIGEEVVIFGGEHPIEELAAQVGTIPYTLTTMITGRPKTEIFNAKT